jgi:hypothetical protein
MSSQRQFAGAKKTPLIQQISREVLDKPKLPLYTALTPAETTLRQTGYG